MPGRVEGKIALVTGAAQGLGEATARMLAREGARVAITDINEEGAIRVARALNALRKGCSDRRFPRRDARGSMAARGRRKRSVAFGGLHVLVNNAGIGLTKDFETITLEEWRHVHAIDLDGVFLGCKLALPLIAKNRESDGPRRLHRQHLVDLGHHRRPQHGRLQFGQGGRAASVEIGGAPLREARLRIRSNSVHPVFIATPILDGLVERLGRDEAYAKLGRQVPLGHIGEPDDIAYAVLYLASDELKFVTGAELKVDGGISAM